MFSYSIWKECPDTGKSSEEYIGGTIDHCTHVPSPVAQSNVEINYNESCIEGMDLSHYRILNNDYLEKDPDLVTEQASFIILDLK